MKIVKTDVCYTYTICEEAINRLKNVYPFIETGMAGRSVLGKNLSYLKIGTGKYKVFINAAHHALEWITTPLVLWFCEDFLQNHVKKGMFLGEDTEKIMEDCALFVVPMVNPDGVDLVNIGFDESNLFYEELKKWENMGVDFRNTWKANIRGVDLNRNYPAEWEKSKRQEEGWGITLPAPTRFGGNAPLSEPETAAMVQFSKKSSFDLVMAYHTQGQEIYWLYKYNDNQKAEMLARKFGELSGYAIQENPSEAAFAGYKDWFIDCYGKPGFTIEAGLGENPLPICDFDQIYKENAPMMLAAMTSYR